MSSNEHHGVPNDPPAGLGLSELLTTTRETVAQQLQHQSVVPMESTIPLGMT